MPHSPNLPPDHETTNQAEDHELLTHPDAAELMQKLNDAEQTANEHWERILRMQADFDNAKRRYEKEIGNAHKYALEKFVAELLPIVDSLELCVANETTEGHVVHSAVKGVKLTLNLFYAAMEKFGIQAVNPTAEIFNPEFQQAISVKEASNQASGTVLSVLQKGYTLNGRLVRPALVVVAK